MRKNYNFDGIKFTAKTEELARGGQGSVRLAKLKSNSAIELILKSMPSSDEVKTRTEYLANLELAKLSPAFAAPLAADISKKDEILHIAPKVDGFELLNFGPMELPQTLEIGLELVTAIALLEEHGISHGDLSFANILIGSDGEVSLIDFDGFITHDQSIPAYMSRGTRPMQAPELRDSDTGVISNPKSDRFAFTVFLSMLFFGQYPTDELAKNPLEVDQLMMSGNWPERQRVIQKDDMPIEALGETLGALFDRGFSLDPDVRPEAEEWRLALSEAINNCWVHKCGNAFVADLTTSHCPFCQESIHLPKPKNEIKILLPHLAQKYGTPIQDQQAIILGRATMSGLPGTVSGRHLEITPIGNHLLLRHIGRHPTLIKHQGQWYQLERHTIPINDLTQNPLQLKLVDCRVEVSVG